MSSMCFKGYRSAVPPRFASNLCTFETMYSKFSWLYSIEFGHKAWKVWPNETTLKYDPIGKLCKNNSNAILAFLIDLPAIDPDQSNTKMNSAALISELPLGIKDKYPAPLADLSKQACLKSDVTLIKISFHLRVWASKFRILEGV